jgi:hypothetical protein
VKRKTLLQYIGRFHPGAFVETGTYRGDTVAAVRSRVPRVLSIELDPTLARLASRRFAKDRNVSIIEGDSARELPGVLTSLTASSLVWLDGHFSGGVTADSGRSPVMHELHAVLRTSVPHVVLIDDVRLFNGTDGYPALADVLDLFADREFDVAVQDDILRVVPTALATWSAHDSGRVQNGSSK